MNGLEAWIQAHNYDPRLGGLALLVFCACLAGLCAAMLFVERPR